MSTKLFKTFILFFIAIPLIFSFATAEDQELTPHGIKFKKGEKKIDGLQKEAVNIKSNRILFKFKDPKKAKAKGIRPDTILKRLQLKNIKPTIKRLKKAKTGKEKLKAQSLMNIFQGEVPKGIDPEIILKQLRKRKEIEYAELDNLSFTFAVPNDTNYSQLSHLQNIQAETAWDTTTGDSSVVVAVVDTGVDYNHSDLVNNIWINSGEIAGDGIDNDGNGFIDDVRGWDFVTASSSVVYAGEDAGPADNDPMDVQGHGTHVAGIVGAEGNNGIGVCGVNWNVSLMVVRAGFKATNGGGALYDSDIANALIYAADNGAHIINMSFGAYAPSQTVREAIDYCASRGVILIAAAGNSDIMAPAYPAAYNKVIAVANLASDKKKDRWSNFGAWIDIAAPGKSILSTVPGGGYEQKSGTSMAAPVIAGTAALIKAAHPTWSPSAITEMLLASGESVIEDNPHYIGKLGSGLINATTAVTAAAPPQNIGFAGMWTQSISGNSDEFMDPGETVVMALSARNFSAEATGVSFYFYDMNDYVTMNDPNCAIGDIKAGQTVTPSDTVSFTIDPATPKDEIVEMRVQIYTSEGYLGLEKFYFVLNPTLRDQVTLASSDATTKYKTPSVMANPNGGATMIYSLQGTPYSIHAREIDSNGNISEEVTISDTSRNCQDQRLAVDANGNAHVLFRGLIGSWDFEYYHTSQDPITKAWSQPVQLTTAAEIYSAEHSASTHALALDDSNNPHIIWEDYRAGNPEPDLYHKYHNGTSWSAEALVSSFTKDPSTMRLVFDSQGTGYAFWHQEIDASGSGIMMKKLENGIWGTSSVVTYATWNDYNVLVDDQDVIHISYPGTSFHVFYRNYNGSTWSPGEDLMTPNTVSEGFMAQDNTGQIHMMIYAYDNSIHNDKMSMFKTIKDEFNWSTPAQKTFNFIIDQVIYDGYSMDPQNSEFVVGSVDSATQSNGEFGAPDDIILFSSIESGALLPSRPVVTDAGAVTENSDSFSFSWSSSHTNGIDKYKYALGTTPGGTDLVYWTDAGTATSATVDLTQIPLQRNLTYYATVMALTDGYWSLPGCSDGIQYEGTGVGIISLSGDLDFGPLVVNQSSQKTITITNLGDGDLTVSNVALASADATITIDWTNGVILPGNSQQVNVSITPTQVVSYSNTLIVTSDADSGDNTMPLSGTVIPEVCDASHTLENEMITNVNIANVNNNSTWSSYSLYPEAVALERGSGYTLSFTVSNNWIGTRYAIWVDWNQDGDFDDTDETQYWADCTDATQYNYTATIIPPTNAPLGYTRMRIRMVYNTTPISCGTEYSGEVEDYIIDLADDVTPNYCIPTHSYENEMITDVQFDSISNYNNDWLSYSDYTAMSNTITRGTSESLSVSINYGWYYSYLSVWIDWNRDGDFDDTEEQVMYIGAAGYYDTTFTTSVTAPTWANPGETRMRVRLVYNTYLDPCGDLYSGEAEDYTVNIN